MRIFYDYLTGGSFSFMDRTVSLCDGWHFFDGKRRPGKKGLLLSKKSAFPYASGNVFTVKKKFICPKQVNDTVTVFFTGNFDDIEVYSGKKKLTAFCDGEKNIYDITKALKTGKTVITAVVYGGTVENFFFSVKRNYE